VEIHTGIQLHPGSLQEHHGRRSTYPAMQMHSPGAKQPGGTGDGTNVAEQLERWSGLSWVHFNADMLTKTPTPYVRTQNPTPFPTASPTSSPTGAPTTVEEDHLRHHESLDHLDEVGRFFKMPGRLCSLTSRFSRNSLSGHGTLTRREFTLALWQTWLMRQVTWRHRTWPLLSDLWVKAKGLLP
jgi:hypothetical protein